jgi:hypothetical protein
MRGALLVAGLIAATAPAMADELAGSWRVKTRDLDQGRSCTIEGALVLSEGAMACKLTLVQQCARNKDAHLIVEETCDYSRKGDEITIKGTGYNIVEAVPRGFWSRQYNLDRFELTLSSDKQTMAGRLRSASQVGVTVTRMKDLSE